MPALEPWVRPQPAAGCGSALPRLRPAARRRAGCGPARPTIHPVVSRLLQRREEAIEIDVPRAQLAEGSAPPGLQRVRAVTNDRLQNVEPNVLDVNVVGPLTPSGARPRSGRCRRAAGVRCRPAARCLTSRAGGRSPTGPRRTWTYADGRWARTRARARAPRLSSGPPETGSSRHRRGPANDPPGLDPDWPSAPPSRHLRTPGARRSPPPLQTARASRSRAARSSSQCSGSLKRIGHQPPVSFSPCSTSARRSSSPSPR